MPAQRTLPVFLSVLFAVGIWVYGVLSLRTDAGTRGGYATLACDDFYSDPEIRERLDSLGFTGLVSESDQWALLDCFGSIEKIPLVEYQQRLLPFDPRNDGYAEKIRSLFVRGGKRFIYIPLSANRLENMETEIARAMVGVPYSLDYTQPPPKRDIFLPLIAFCLTAFIFLVIPPLRLRLNAGLLPCLIALSPLALGLAPGFALAALLAGFASLLVKPPGRKAPFSAGPQSGFDLPAPFTAKWLLGAALIVCYGFFSFFSGLPVPFVFLVLAVFCCLLLVTVRQGGGAVNGGINSGKRSIKFPAKKTYSRNRRFIPVEIISRRNTENYGFFTVMLPFTVMALALAFAGFAMPKPPSLPVVNVSPQTFLAMPEVMITEADFQEHYLFQTAFSFRALGKTDEAGEAPVGEAPAIAGYELSSDGLLTPGAPSVGGEIQIPDFPLRDFLKRISSDPSPRVADEVKRDNSYDWLFTPLPMIFILPAFIHSIWKKRQGKIRSGFAGFYR